MFSNFPTFEDFLNSETYEQKQNRLAFQMEKKNELKRFITQINKEIFLDILPIKVIYFKANFKTFLER